MQVVWTTMRHTGEPLDQQAHLFGQLWATVGPDDHAGPGGWSWAVFHMKDPRGPVAEGFAYDEGDAKNAVLAWARPRAPRTLRRRLRSLARARR